MTRMIRIMDLTTGTNWTEKWGQKNTDFAQAFWIFLSPFFCPSFLASWVLMDLPAAFSSSDFFARRSFNLSFGRGGKAALVDKLAACRYVGAFHSCSRRVFWFCLFSLQEPTS